MKNIFCSTVSLDKLRERLTKRNITSLLVLTTIAAALFATPTAAFASSHVRETGSPLPAPSNMLNTLTSIHMLDQTHGWALIASSILHTVDGGLHWQNVTPANANIDHPLFKSNTDFLNDQDAWVAPPQPLQKSISLLRTTDGGKSWQNSTIQTTVPVILASPYFLNASDGWLQASGNFSAGSALLLIFQTTDGGQHWKQLGSPNQKDIPYPSGISFSDAQNGWETGANPAAVKADTINPAQPLLEVTHDGSQTWHSQSLAVPPGVGKSTRVSTRPPVFFGNTGLLPVETYSLPLPGTSSLDTGLGLYVTHNGGQTWTPTKLLTNNGNGQGFLMTVNIIDVVDSQHAWADLGSNFYATSDGGQSWTQLPPTPQPIGEFSFIDTNTGWAISIPNMTPGNTKNQQPNLLHTTDGGHTWQQINYSFVGKPITPLPLGTGGTSTKPITIPSNNCESVLFYQAAQGSTELTLNSWTNDDPLGHVKCFLQAFQQCRPASIGFSVTIPNPPNGAPKGDLRDAPIFGMKSELGGGGGGGTITNYSFSTKPQPGSCAISESFDVNMAPPTQQTCARVVQTGTKLSFVDCGKSGTITFSLVLPKSTQGAVG